MRIIVDTDKNDWNRVKSAALTTIHKTSFKSGITSKWKEAMILGRHSPIREFRILVNIDDIPRWIADQLVRHTVGVNNYMGTMRPDRGNVPRAEQTMETLTSFRQSYNIDSFLTMCHSRLCVGVVSRETRELVEEIVEILALNEPEIAKYCVPPCIYMGGCKEAPLLELMRKPKCNFYKNFVEGNAYSMNLSSRYCVYGNKQLDTIA